MSQKTEEITVCVSFPSRESLFQTETFIKNHIECLPARMKVIYGKNRFYDESDKPIDSSVIKYLIENEICVVLAEYGPTGVRLMESCREAQVPLVVHFHGYDAYRQDILRKYQENYLKLFEQSTSLISPSKSLAEQLIRLGAPRNKVAICPVGVNVSFFTGANPETTPPHFVAVGRFVEKKAPQLTLMAFKQVLQEAPDASLTMIGEGPLLDGCQKLVKMLKIEHRVEFCSSFKPNEILDNFRKARCFVQHSMTARNGDSESGPVSIKEASAAGLPVVSTYHAGIPDIVVHGETGFLVNEKDVNEMARYMTVLALNPSLAQKMGEAAARRINEHFSLKWTIENLWQVILRSINQ